MFPIPRLDIHRHHFALNKKAFGDSPVPHCGQDNICLGALMFGCINFSFNALLVVDRPVIIQYLNPSVIDPVLS